MKKIVTILCALALFLGCSACTVNFPVTQPEYGNLYENADMPVNLPAGSKERDGAPDSVVLDHASINADESSYYEILHNVDTTSHIDEPRLILYFIGPYGSQTQSQTLKFQYDRSSDIWTFIDVVPHKGIYVDFKQELNEAAYINESSFNGTNRNETFDFSITFHEIDFINMTASIDYTIDAIIDRNDISGYTTVDLSETGHRGEIEFSIPYESLAVDWGGYTTETRYYTFQLDYKDGIRSD